MVSKARGREFDFLKNGSLCYYGQTVLHFACMTGKANIVEYLIDNNADVNEVTELTGNNVLHLLAQAKGMETQTFKRIFQLLKTRDPAMLQQKNNKMDDEKHPGDMTPFELGVFEQNANILEGIKQILWDFDKTVQYLVPLNELDPLLRSNQDDKLSLIELAVKNNDKDILSHPVIDTILKWKWKMYAQYIFLGRFLVTFFLVAVVYTPVISLQPSNYDQRRGYGNFTDGWEVFRLIWELLAVFGALILLFWTAFNDAVIKSWKVLNELNRWEYINRWAFSLFILSIPLTRVLGQIPGVNETAMLNAENVLFTFGAIAGWIYLLDFAKGSEHIGPLIVVVWKIVTRDLLQWLWIFIPVCMGFASGFFLQMQDVPIETSSVKDWDQFIGAAVWTVRFLFGQAAYDDFRAAKMPWFTYTMFIIYGFIAVILLVNVLIGKVVDTFTNVNADSERVWRVELGALIMSIDMHLSSKAKQRYRENFGLTSMAAGREGIRYFQFTEHCVKFRNGESTVMEVLVKRDLKDDGSVDERVWKAKELENWHDFRAGFFEILKRVMWGESLIGLADDKRKW
ncbi:hypothetical protein BCR33DRAFT_772102 [Rhizoclosmatium globosum]|uniref:Ion transport domain-containing protein n=1 Tax=Rhizoclosmatium globosum TaxID=329046 RepID=A0A1Y2B778_9FUNG|nr:hypothetical protein BCR33DRAFT_772102 [Rhizoclosmatium globosum]|eukprot:ORY30698.1 hypothetical protein BCR33DRAFT_772102 [Rhizoclosmatium globosum]